MNLRASLSNQDAKAAHAAAAVLMAQLALAREQAGRYQRDVAEESGLAQSQISYWEAGRSVPNLISIIRLADVLGHELVLVPKEEPMDVVLKTIVENTTTAFFAEHPELNPNTTSLEYTPDGLTVTGYQTVDLAVEYNPDGSLRSICFNPDEAIDLSVLARDSDGFSTVIAVDPATNGFTAVGPTIDGGQAPKHNWECETDGTLKDQEIYIPEAPEENHHTCVQCLTCGKWSGCINCESETLETECEGLTAE